MAPNRPFRQADLKFRLGEFTHVDEHAGERGFDRFCVARLQPLVDLTKELHRGPVDDDGVAGGITTGGFIARLVHAGLVEFKAGDEFRPQRLEIGTLRLFARHRIKNLRLMAIEDVDNYGAIAPRALDRFAHIVADFFRVGLKAEAGRQQVPVSDKPLDVGIGHVGGAVGGGLCAEFPAIQPLDAGVLSQDVTNEWFWTPIRFEAPRKLKKNLGQVALGGFESSGRVKGIEVFGLVGSVCAPNATANGENSWQDHSEVTQQ